MDVSRLYETALNRSNISNQVLQTLFADYSLLETVRFWPNQVVISAIYIIITILSLVLNVITVVVLVKGDKISSELYPYLINLSVSDVFMSLFCIPYTYSSFILNRWIYPHFLCPTANFVQICSVFVSIWTLTVIGIDRYFAVINPLGNPKRCISSKWPKCFLGNKLFTIILIWVGGIASGSLEFIYTKVISFPFGSEIVFDCQENLPGKYSKPYTIYIFASTFGVPFVILLYVYSVIGYNVWRHVAPGNPHHSRDRNINLTRDRVIKILSIIVLLFFVCWCPLQIFNLLVEFVDNFLQVKIGQEYNLFVYGYLVCHILAMSHSFVNPIIYCFISQNFWLNFCALTRTYLLRLVNVFNLNQPRESRRKSYTDTRSVRTVNSPCNTILPSLKEKQANNNAAVVQTPIPSKNMFYKVDQTQIELNVVNS